MSQLGSPLLSWYERKLPPCVDLHNVAISLLTTASTPSVEIGTQKNSKLHLSIVMKRSFTLWAPIEAGDIKRWQEYTEEQYKKDLHDPDNHNGVITHLEPDILECEVKWALESIY